jgi:hypothetical protein
MIEIVLRSIIMSNLSTFGLIYRSGGGTAVVPLANQGRLGAAVN